MDEYRRLDKCTDDLPWRPNRRAWGGAKQSSGGRRFLIAGPAVDDGHICRPTHGPEGWGLRNSPTADECHAWAP
jgi:hypothetical protein